MQTLHNSFKHVYVKLSLFRKQVLFMNVYNTAENINIFSKLVSKHVAPRSVVCCVTVVYKCVLLLHYQARIPRLKTELMSLIIIIIIIIKNDLTVLSFNSAS